MRASGISSLQLLGTVGIAGIALAVLMALIGESLAPSLSGYASEMRQQALRSDNGATSGPATWLRDGDRILSVGRQTGELGYGGGVLLFELGPDQTLKEVARADSADIDAQSRWVLSNYAETSFLDNGVDTHSAREATQTYSLNPNLLVSVVREDRLDTPALWRYIRYLKDNSLDPKHYEIAYVDTARVRRVRRADDGSRAAVRVRGVALGGCGLAPAGRARHRARLLHAGRSAREQRRSVQRGPCDRRLGAERRAARRDGDFRRAGPLSARSS